MTLLIRPWVYNAFFSNEPNTKYKYKYEIRVWKWAWRAAMTTSRAETRGVGCGGPAVAWSGPASPIPTLDSWILLKLFPISPSPLSFNPTPFSHFHFLHRQDVEKGNEEVSRVKNTCSKLTRDDLSDIGVKSNCGKSVVSIGGKSFTTATNIPVIIRAVSNQTLPQVS